MHAATVDLLVQKAHLEPDTSLANATAIDMALNNAQLVTVPDLDARLSVLEAKIDARFAAFKAEMDARFATFKAEMDVRFAAIDSRFTALEAKMDAALEKTKAELVRWVFLVMLGNVALSVAASAVVNALQHAR